MIKALPDIQVVIIRMDRVPYIAQSGLYALEEAIMDLQSRDIIVAFTGLQGQPKDMVERINLAPGLVPEKYIFDTFEECVMWIQQHLQESDILSRPVSTDSAAEQTVSG